MSDTWLKWIQWFRLKINKTSVFLIKKKRERKHARLFSANTRFSSLVSHSSSSSIPLTAMPPFCRRPRRHASRHRRLLNTSSPLFLSPPVSPPSSHTKPPYCSSLPHQSTPVNSLLPTFTLANF